MDRSFAIACIIALSFSVGGLAQPAPPYGLAQIHNDNSILVYWFYPQVNDTVFTAYDGDPQSYLFYSSENVGARLAVGLDLTGKAHAIEAVEIRLWPQDPFPQHPGNQYAPFKVGLRSWLDTNPAAPALWQSELTCSPDDASSWQSLPVRKRILTDSLYLEFEWLPDTPTAPLPCIAFSGSFVGSYLGHVEGGRLSWDPITDAGVLMRLRVSESDLQAEPPAEDLLPDSFRVLVFDSPTADGLAEALVLTVRDSLHVEIPRAETEGKYVVVAAWQDELLSPKSEMIRLDAATSAEAEPSPATAVSLSQNYPNPFNSETVIELLHPDDVAVFDLLGRRVVSLRQDGRSRGGSYTFRWSGRDLTGRPVPSGVYFYRQTGRSGVGKMLLLK